MTDVQSAIALAKAAFPDLGVFGFGKGGDEQFDRDQVATAIACLQHCRKTKRATVSSYWLKHVIEHWGRSVGLEPYVTNGAAIVAAVALGFPVKRGADCNFSPINAGIGISRSDVDKIEVMRIRRMRDGSLRL